MSAPLVAGIGYATVNFLGRVPRYPEPDTKTELVEASLQGGGPAATALCVACALGARARLLCKIADDDFGRFILRSLDEAGVDRRFAVVGHGSFSPLSFVGIDDLARRTIYYTRGDVPPLTAAEVDPAFLDGADVLVVDGHHAEAQVAAAGAAKARNIPVVFGAGSVRNGVGELLELADVLIASERFASEVAPRGELEDSLAELVRLGPERVVITLGDAGSIGIHHAELVRQEAYPVDAVDTTGAGDVYLGAFATAMSQGYEFVRCIQVASAASALACRALGGRAGIPDREEVLAFLGWSERVR